MLPGAKTPMHGSQTPIYEAGGRTPHYGAATPSHDGSRTPAHGAWDPAAANTPARPDFDYGLDEAEPGPNYDPPASYSQVTHTRPPACVCTHFGFKT